MKGSAITGPVGKEAAELWPVSLSSHQNKPKTKANISLLAYCLQLRCRHVKKEKFEKRKIRDGNDTSWAYGLHMKSKSNFFLFKKWKKAPRFDIFFYYHNAAAHVFHVFETSTRRPPDSRWPFFNLFLFFIMMTRMDVKLHEVYMPRQTCVD